MSEQHRDFDAQKLAALKDKHSGYKICPRCGASLEAREIDNHIRMVCPSDECGFIFYQNPIPAAGAIIVENDSILLVKRSHPPRIGDWCIPAGFMEWKEHPSRTAVRELKEETGLEVRLTELFEVYSGNDDPRANAVLILYLAEIIGGKMEPGDDAQDVRFFPFSELPDNIAFVAHVQALADYSGRFRNET
ncbi:MAG: NUDIX hydrolase [bacterium]|nr:NUDIX hydrolase [bacterium]